MAGKCARTKLDLTRHALADRDRQAVGDDPASTLGSRSGSWQPVDDTGSAICSMRRSRTAITAVENQVLPTALGPGQRWCRAKSPKQLTAHDEIGTLVSGLIGKSHEGYYAK
jgi:hypothetical protein